MEQLIAQGPAGMAAVFTRLFNLAMRFERENFLGARHYERRDERRGYANGVKSKRIDTPAGTLILDVPKTADTDEPFYPRSLERGTRSSRALMLAVAEMYVKGQGLRMKSRVGVASGSLAIQPGA
jgi:transposase-like protein